MSEASSYYPSLISIYLFPLRSLPQFKLMRNLILEQNYIGDINLINVNINGRSLIELDSIEQLFSQSNCTYCKKIELDELNKLTSNEQSPTEKTEDESSIESNDQFTVSNKLENSNVNNNEQQNKHKSTHQDTNNHQNSHHSNQNNHKKSTTSTKINKQTLKTDQPVNNNLLINLKRKLEINSLANQKYKEIMQTGGMLQSIGPHVIDIISFITNLKAKKCNGILRTFNLSPFTNELCLIKRLNVDDFCTFQMQMDKVTSNSYLTKQSILMNKSIDEKTNKNDKNKTNEQKTNNKQASQVKFDFKKQAKKLSNNEPIAIVNLNDHLDTAMDKGYEIVIAGEFGYLRLKNGNLFGRQYEQNNNDGSANLDSLDEEKAFYLIKDNLKLNNFCILHQNQELSKLIINNKQPIKPFELGLEKLIESIKNAFDNEQTSIDTKSNNLLNNDSDKMNGTKKLVDAEDKKETKIVIISNEATKESNGKTKFKINLKVLKKLIQI